MFENLETLRYNPVLLPYVYLSLHLFPRAAIDQARSFTRFGKKLFCMFVVSHDLVCDVKTVHHGVQRRMVLVDKFIEFFKLLFFALLLIYAT